MSLPSKPLQGCRVLLVEDEFMLADELRAELEDAGAVVIGPFGSLAAAIRLIRTEPRIDGAILDGNLGGELVHPAADLLVERGVPFLFTTGYDPAAIPPRFSTRPQFEKPVSLEAVIHAMIRIIGRGHSDPSDP